MNKKILKLAIAFLCLTKSMTAAIEIEFGSAQLQGHVSKKKSTIEDRIVTKKRGTQGFFAVFDGHSGDSVSNYAAEHLLKFLQKNIKDDDDLASEIRRNIVNFDIHMFNDVCKRRNLVGGTTACIVYIPKDSDTIFCANLGDSRAVLFTGEGIANQPLSNDHKPSDKSEKERIEAAGVKATMDGKIVGTVQLPTEKKYFFASTSRALGDFLPGWKHADLLSNSWFSKKYIKAETPIENFPNHPISNVPEVSTYTVESYHKFIVIGSDGLWNVMKNEEVGRFVATHLQNSSLVGGAALNQIAKELVTEAANRWQQLNEENSTILRDDISVIIIQIMSNRVSQLPRMRPTFLPSYEPQKVVSQNIITEFSSYSSMQKVVIGGGASAVAAGGVWGSWKIVNWLKKHWKKDKDK